LTKKNIAFFEIILILTSGVAFAYLTGQTNSLIETLPIESKESKFISFIREKALNYLSHGLVSAQTGIKTCLLNNDGSYCQEYPSNVCNSECASQGGCFPGRRTDYSLCQLGTCFDTELGLCSAGSPRASCEGSGVTWYPQNTPVQQCNRGCCLIAPDGSGGASQARLTTNRECNNLEQTLGVLVEWDSQTTGEVQCLQKVRTQREGACVLAPSDNEILNNCEFTTEVRCATRGGDFYSGQLCTNSQLNTKCEMTENAQCFDGKDGLYFVDNCKPPNRANIYDYQKRNNNGYWQSVVPSEQICTLSRNNQGEITNEQSCGNCDYLTGSICGTVRGSIDTNPSNNGQYVCRDLYCVDESGERREHGESWCAFDSWTGLDGQPGTNEERAVDVPGSRQYKKLCFEGEIRTEPAPEYRNGLCVEQDVTEDFTNANPRTNTGALCTAYNKNVDELSKCEESPDCFLKHVEIDRWKFDVCVPKYPLGFELNSETPQQDSQAICAAASQTCTYYEKKNIEGRWTCRINCGCKEREFAETMNNLCISLGDCGSKVNLAGELGDGHSVSGDRQPSISDDYVEGLKKYITPKPGQRVDGLTNEQIEALFGVDFNFEDPDMLGAQIAQLGLGVGVYIYSGVISYATGLSATAPTAVTPFGIVTSVGAVGAGIGYIVGLALGLEGDDLTNAVLIGAGLAVGAYYAGLLNWAVGATATGPWGWIAAVIVLIGVVILSIGGVGEYREKHVTFNCLPWEPPSGGTNCDKCDDLGVQCTAYKCASLGKTCQLLNPDDEAFRTCVNINPNDVADPDISFNATSIPQGYTFVESDNGVEIRSGASDGAIQEHTAVTFGILTNEPSQCKISAVRPENGYDEMEDTYFDSSLNAYVSAHTDVRAMLTLDDLSAPGINQDPSRRGDYNLYVLCQDKSGNDNDVEYNIRFKISPANDIQPPVITRYVPESPGVTGLTSTNFNLQFITDEPATCKFSSLDVNYEIMENSANCNNDLTAPVIVGQSYGWLCNAILPVTADQNNYYFRCADKPDLGEDVQQTGITLPPERNANAQSMPEGGPYIVRKTTTPLTISSVNPNGATILSAAEPVPVTLDVVTAGGIDNGKSFCEYSLNSGTTYVPFFTTSLSNHRQVFSTGFFAGDYNIRLNCTDRAGNIAEGNSLFTVQVDNVGPLITRVYNSGNSLNVITNEASVCEYSLDSCAFEFESGIALSGAGKVHTMPYQNGNIYKIKCRDSFENVGSCLTVSGGY
ncbi:MAG: DMT family transporter, partial [Nanoarchaeota archaeon]